MYKSRNQCNELAIEYNPLVAKNLEQDQDYCIRGMVYDSSINMYCEWDDFITIEKSEV